MTSSYTSKKQCGIGKPRGRRRDRDCQTCKTRGVKCDLNRPSCGECIEAGIECHGYGARVVWMNHTSSRPKPKSLSTQHSEQGRSSTQNDAMNLSYKHSGSLFTTSINLDGTRDSFDWCAVDRNSFIKPLVLLCQDIIHSNETTDSSSIRSQLFSAEAISLLSRLRDLAQARYNCNTTTTEPWESEDATQYRLDALASLKQTLDAVNPVALVGIAAFAFFDVCESEFGQWRRHLLGAKSLLDIHCTCKEELDKLAQNISGLDQLVARLVWFDITGAIIRGTGDLVFDPWHHAVLTETFFHTVGCTSDTFEFFLKIASGDAVADSQAMCLSAMLQLADMGLETRSNRSDWDRCADAYRCAAVLAMLGRMEDNEAIGALKDSMISSTVDRTCRIIIRIPSSSSYYIHLATPAYLAGMNATKPQQWDIIRRYWRGSYQHTGLRRYPDGLARCEKKWRANNEAGCS